MNDEAATVLLTALALPSSPPLDILDFSGNSRLTTDWVPALARLLLGQPKNRKPIRQLLLSDTPVGDNGAAEIAQPLAESTTIQARSVPVYAACSNQYFPAACRTRFSLPQVSPLLILCCQGQVYLALGSLLISRGYPTLLSWVVQTTLALKHV